MKIISKPDPFDVAIWGLILTAIIALIYYGQLRSMQDQVTETQKQTAEIRRQTVISERPWLSVEVTPNSDVFFVDDNGGKYAA